LVDVSVSVTDAKGNFVAGLTRQQFHIFDEGAEQPITNFASIGLPVQILLLVETSPAVYLIHREHLEAAYLLLDGLAPDDEVALATYDDALHPLLPLSADKASIAAALGDVRYTLGTAQLHLYQSLARAIDELAPMAGKKAVVLLSTGLDDSAGGDLSENSPQHAENEGWEKLASRLRASGVVVYPVALGGELRDPGNRSGAQNAQSAAAAQVRAGFDRADHALREMAQLSGGLAFFPRRASDFAAFYRRISSAMRHEYSLGFVPPTRDARTHKIEVRVFDAHGRQLAPGEGRSRYQVQARPGYVAPAP
jgi:VWFA-related protein